MVGGACFTDGKEEKLSDVGGRDMGRKQGPIGYGIRIEVCLLLR